MRGDYIGAGTLDADQIITPSTSTIAAAATPTTGSNLEANMQPAKTPGSLVWLLSLAALYFVYYYFYNKKWKEVINADAVLSFLHNALTVTILAVVGINLMNVFLTKVGALKIPFLSKAAGTMLPLFHL
jgi:hypothetical protein